MIRHLYRRRAAAIGIALIGMATVPSGRTIAAEPPPTATTARDAGQWTRFRGPNGSGLSDADIPAQWTDADWNWTTVLPGGGNSSPVVLDGRIYLLCADDRTGDHMVVCVNAKDGSIRWTRRYPSHTYSHNGFNSYASGSPTVDAKGVYVCWSTPEEFTVTALDHDGKELWSRDLGPFISQHGGGQSPIVYGDLVIVGGDQEGPASWLFGLDRETGRVAWRTPRGHTDKFSASTPCVFEPKDGSPEIIFTSKAHGFTAIDPHNGHVMWEVGRVFDARAVASPYIADGLIIGSCGDGPTGHELAAIRPSDDGKSARTVYILKRAVPYVPTSVVKNGLLFYITDNGVATCLRADTGRPVWKQRLDGNFFGSLVCAKDRIFALSKEGEAYVLAASDHFQLLARNALKVQEESDVPPLSTTPAIADGHMYLRTYTHLISIGGKH